MHKYNKLTYNNANLFLLFWLAGKNLLNPEHHLQVLPVDSVQKTSYGNFVRQQTREEAR